MILWIIYPSLVLVFYTSVIIKLITIYLLYVIIGSHAVTPVSVYICDGNSVGRIEFCVLVHIPFIIW